MNYPNRKIIKGEADKQIVTAIQQKLKDTGCGPEKVDGDFGERTAEAVMLFQSLHRDKRDSPLVIDGEVGPITWEVLFGAASVAVPAQPLSTLFAKVMDTARKEIDTMEDPIGSNSGPRINQYLKSVGLDPGFFWCAAFVYWCYNESCLQLGRPNPLLKTAGCMEHWNRTTGKKIPKSEAENNPSLVKAGQIFIINHGKGAGHTGLVERVDGGSIFTIEGNSNNDGSRNGIGVFLLPRPRKINTISAGFIEYT